MNQESFTAKTVTFDFSTLALGERRMDDLLNRAKTVSAALKAARIPHAVVGGLAVRAYEASVGESPSLTTNDMDILMRREDLDKAVAVLTRLNFEYRVVMGTPAFIPSGGNFRNGIHVLISGEKPKKSSLHPAPPLDEQALVSSSEGFPVIDLSGLLYMKLSSLRPKDAAHIIHLMELNLITDEVRRGLPADLQDRLSEIIKQNQALEE